MLTTDRINNLRRFIHTLRTTPLTQGRLSLHCACRTGPDGSTFSDPNAHCALGIADLLLDRTVPLDTLLTLIPINILAADCMPATYIFGLTSKEISNILHMNDICGKTFSEIADWLEQGPLARLLIDELTQPQPLLLPQHATQTLEPSHA